MKASKLFFTFLLLLFWTCLLEARHIIGGEITYVCRGNGDYDFTMFIYRDCAGGGACFDSDATCPENLLGHLTIFEGETILTTLILSQPQITNIEPNLSNPCLIAPPNVCVEEGIYRFSAKLPLSTNNVTVAYQRCCRNNFITNIISPATSGSTYTTTLFPETRDSCNSSPTFNDFPPIVICRGEDVNFDHSATDPDGDSLVYSFCTPFYGGGWDGMPNPDITGPFGLAPDPETAPPYEAVRFSGGFSYQNPLPESGTRELPSVRIDAETGLISGFPGNIGQYVVGVCVRAYKNGKLINEVRRDFQFNVADCDNDLRVDVEETEIRQINGEDVFYIRICGDDVIINESTNLSYIDDVYWEFDIPGGKTTSTKFDPSDLNFPGEGPYDGFLTLNPDYLQCTATGLVQIEIYPEITADFEFDYDTCKSDPVEFINLSVSKAGPEALVELRWEIDTATIFTKDLSYQFPDAGQYDVKLTARDSNHCSENITKEISFFPIPPFLIVTPSIEEACVPAEIRFENFSNPITAQYDILWDFGDGNSGQGVSPTHTYEDPGIYTVSMDVTSPFGCHIDTTYTNFVTTLPSPIADFTFSPQEVSRLDPVVTFTDQSQDAIRWDWLFSGFGVSREINPVYTFTESGSQLVRLVVTAENFCRDTTYSEVIIVPDIAYTLPNAFTPNGDGINDTFYGVGNAYEAVSFHLSIWNRWGEMIFETNNALDEWNGRKNNQGEEAPNGVYVVKVRYVDHDGEVTNLNGLATVIR